MTIALLPPSGLLAHGCSMALLCSPSAASVANEQICRCVPSTRTLHRGWRAIWPLLCYRLHTETSLVYVVSDGCGSACQRFSGVSVSCPRMSHAWRWKQWHTPFCRFLVAKPQTRVATRVYLHGCTYAQHTFGMPWTRDGARMRAKRAGYAKLLARIYIYIAIYI